MLAKDLTKLLDKYNLTKEIIIYVLNEIFNLNIKIATLKYIRSCDIASLIEIFQGSCFEHTVFKACQYVSLNEIFCKGLKFVFVKTA